MDTETRAALDALPADSPLRAYIAHLIESNAQLIEQMGDMEAEAERQAQALAKRGRQIRQLRTQSTSPLS